MISSGMRMKALIGAAMAGFRSKVVSPVAPITLDSDRPFLSTPKGDKGQKRGMKPKASGAAAAKRAAVKRANKRKNKKGSR